MEQLEKKLEDITRKEWVAYRWIEIPPTMDDSDDDLPWTTQTMSGYSEVLAVVRQMKRIKH